ncbi:T9SS C-terminal target domain-containing protein [Chryseobacterium sp. G0240]|uniref:fibronectin type III domain-containing protein n=1 Tax=Chryseobacterium sp. G0240 TaxID=2487066 RepID=UPI000F44785A|nr:fibronectin type III domain-containing protein [Chryseobacterium sp. G0240]ROI01133.1 T9SS C-terminal target domain-containing protein [Chryseobacterium sp. G0240]
MKKRFSFNILLCFVIIIGVISSCTSASFPYNENFSTSDGSYDFVNTGQTNKWLYGSAAGNPPKALYISNDNGTSNAYNINNTSVVHAYRDISIPVGTSITNFSFDWRGGGENSQDYLRVWLVPTSYTPTAGTKITAGSGRIQVGNDFNQQPTWQAYINSNLNLSSFAGGTLRLVFEWSNNNSIGAQPPAAIDNISLNSCFVPTPTAVTGITATAATLNWTAPFIVPVNGYEYYYTTTSIPPNAGTAATGATNNVSVNLTQLSANTTYYWWIRSVCGSNDKSFWVSGGNFTTKSCNTITPIITVNGITHNSATISWSQNNNAADSFQIRYRPVGTSSWSTANPAAAVPPAVNTFTLSNLLPVTLYEVEVATVCGTTIGAYSHNEFTTKCDPTPPNVTISNITTISALITWAPLAANSTYVMRWREVGTTSWNPVNLPAPPSNTFTLTNLTANKTYEVQIANQCAGNPTPNPYSNPKVFTTEKTCDLPPSGLTITQLLPTSAEVQWDAFPGATYILRYRKVGISSWAEISTPTNNVILSGLTELTKYEMQVVNICNGVPGTYTPLYFFTIPTVVYCKMVSENSTGEYISKVTVKPNGKPVMENTSGASTSSDYTNTASAIIEMIQGSTGNEIIIEKKWTGMSYNEGIAVWIDFNRNGEFDINERVFTSPPTTTSPVSGKFDVPADAFVSMNDQKFVVMRVAMQRGAIPVNCQKIPFGEVENYKVKISKKDVPNPVDQTEILIYPNPVSSILNVKNISKEAKYKLYNATGTLVSSGVILNNKINLSKLINGVYIIDIDDNGTGIRKKFIKE